MTMDHEQIRELISPYLDGELDLLTARQTEQHLRNCVDCRGVERALRALRETLRAKPTGIVLGDAANEGLEPPRQTVLC